jgi:hypothetical protein
MQQSDRERLRASIFSLLIETAGERGAVVRLVESWWWCWVVNVQKGSHNGLAHRLGIPAAVQAPCFTSPVHSLHPDPNPPLAHLTADSSIWCMDPCILFLVETFG